MAPMSLSFDTAGRLQIDDDLVGELEKPLNREVDPHENTPRCRRRPWPGGGQCRQNISRTA